ncbi:hypothetical protein L7F22_023138 [Adiantum nelumboides]|nr:hypothetical protein [Adiantum nelumboides]
MLNMDCDIQNDDGLCKKDGKEVLVEYINMDVANCGEVNEDVQMYGKEEVAIRDAAENDASNHPFVEQAMGKVKDELGTTKLSTAISKFV